VGWVPFLVLFTGAHEDRYLSIVGFAALLTFFLYRVNRWRSLPFTFARDKWEKDQQLRFLLQRLEQRDHLLRLTPHEFEGAVARLFGFLGFTAQQTRFSGDGGWDVDLRCNQRGRYLVECKQFAIDRTVGRPLLQKLHSALITEKAQGAICVTTGAFSRPAQEFAKAHGIELVNGEALGGLMTKVYGIREALMVKGLCRACGKTAQFEPEDFAEIFRACPSGHMVKHPFITEAHPSVSERRRQLESAGQWPGG
jgi:restriction system protein